MIRSEAAQRLRERDELIYLLRAFPARVAKLADARDLKSRGAKAPYRFDSGPGHHVYWGLACVGGSAEIASEPLAGPNAGLFSARAFSSASTAARWSAVLTIA
jgi:hypothetical protein